MIATQKISRPVSSASVGVTIKRGRRLGLRPAGSGTSAYIRLPYRSLATGQVPTEVAAPNGLPSSASYHSWGGGNLWASFRNSSRESGPTDLSLLFFRRLGTGRGEARRRSAGSRLRAVGFMCIQFEWQTEEISYFNCNRVAWSFRGQIGP